MGPYKSTWRRVIAAVPEAGTKLGPLFKYVDDCAVTEAIKKCHLESSTLQREIDYVNNWSIDNNLKVNVKKPERIQHINVSCPAFASSFGYRRRDS